MSAPPTLKALRDALNGLPRDADAAIEYATANGLPVAHGEIAFDDLPTYGGAAPANTTGVYSWSEGQLLVLTDIGGGAGPLSGNSFQLSDKPFALIPRDPLARQLSELIRESGISVSRFARAIGRDRGSVEAWLTGEQTLTQVMRDWIPRAVLADVAGGVQILVRDEIPAAQG